MTAQDMMDRVSARIAADKANADAVRNAQIEEMLVNMGIVEARLDELRAIAPVVNRLVVNRLVPLHGMVAKVYTDLETNGIDHNLGFACNCRPHEWFGCEAGGYCGSASVYVNVDSGKWASRLSRFPSGNVAVAWSDGEEFARHCAAQSRFVRDHIRSMAQGGIDRYLAKVNGYVAKL